MPMSREHIYYATIGCGLLVIVAIAVWQFWPEQVEPLPPPAVVAQTLDTSSQTEQQVAAANQFVRHGPAARQEVRTALTQHQRYEPEVVEPLVQATMKNRDYRSMPTLIELLNHDDPMVGGRGGAAITKSLGVDVGYRAELPEDQRKKMIEAIRMTYENSMPQLREHYSGQGE